MIAYWNHGGTLYLEDGTNVGSYRRYRDEEWRWWLRESSHIAHEASSREECIAALERATVDVATREAGR